MNDSVRQLRQLQKMIRVRETQARLALNEISQRHCEQVSSRNYLESAHRRREDYEGAIVHGGAWADSIGGMRRAEVAFEQARNAVAEAQQKYRQARSRQERLLTVWAGRFRAEHLRRVERSEDEQ